MTARNAHWIWLGSPPPDPLFANIARFRSLDTAHAYACHLWLDRPWAPPLERSLTGLAIQQLSTLFENSSQPVGQALSRAQAAIRRESEGAGRNYAAASDIARYVVLFAEGGLYMDADMVVKDIWPLNPLYTVAQSSDRLFVPFQNRFGLRRIYNGVLISRAGHPFLLKAMEQILAAYEQLPSFKSKRHFDPDGRLRLEGTRQHTGIEMLHDLNQRRGRRELVEFSAASSFEIFEASGYSYTVKPAFQRRDSAPS